MYLDFIIISGAYSLRWNLLSKDLFERIVHGEELGEELAIFFIK
jgi:hypothetical protein